MANENKDYMVRVAKAANLREIYEVPSTTPARAVDSLHFVETSEVRYVGSPMPLPVRTFGPFAFVELETGFESTAGEKTVVFVKPDATQHVNM